MKKVIISSLVAATFIQSAATAKGRDLDLILGTVGAVTGGMIGNELGNRDTRVATTIISVVAGAVIGHELGRALDESDRRAHSEAQRRAFQGRVNERYTWNSSRNSRTGARGEIIVLREGRSRRDSLSCREYRSVINVGQRQEVNQGIACQRRDGSWYEVNEQEVSFNGVVVESERTETRSNIPNRRQDSVIIVNQDNDKVIHSRHSQRRSREEFKCVSRDNDGQRPYVMAIRNNSTYEVTKLRNLVFSNIQDCENNINELALVDDDVFTCASRDSDGSRPYSLFILDQRQASRLALTYSDIGTCKTSLSKSRITREVVALCASRDNDGSRPWVIHTIDRDTRALKKTMETFSTIEECYRNL